MNRIPGIRAFVAVPLPDRVKELIQNCQGRLQSLIQGQAVRWVRPEQLHLTLKFYGKVAAKDVTALISALRPSCGNACRFKLSLADLGCFPSHQRPSVLWLGVSGDSATLVEIQKKIEAATQTFGSHAEDRHFHPHLTIGRVKAGGSQSRLVGQIVRDHRLSDFPEWEVREVELIQSSLSPQGTSYRSLAVLPLGARREPGKST